MQAMAEADDHEGRVELSHLNENQLLHDEFDELGLIELRRGQLVAL